MAVGHRRQDAPGEKLPEEDHLALVAGGAEPAAFAGERHEKFVPALRTAHACEALFEVAALEEFPDHIGDHAAQRPVAVLVALGIDAQELLEMRIETAPERRGFRVPGAIGLHPDRAQNRKWGVPNSGTGQKIVSRKMKAETRPRYHRLRRIVEMVREGGAGGRLPNRSHFRRELEVSARTLARDLDFLRDEERAPIEYDSARHGYRFSDETWELPAVSLSRREVFAFSLARRLLEVFEGTPLAMDMRSTLDKIAESLEGRFPVRLESLTEHVGVLGEARAAVDPGTWESVARAIERRETLRVDYRRFDGRRGEYEIEPYHLLAYQGNWYALARSRASGKVQTFALSRMAAPRATGESFERAAGFDWRAFAREAFGIAHGEKVHRVRLLFAPRVASQTDHPRNPAGLS